MICSTFPGRLEPIVFIDISKGYKEFVTVSIIMDNNPLFTETIKLRNSVGELKKSIRQKIPASVRDTKYYRYDFISRSLHSTFVVRPSLC